MGAAASRMGGSGNRSGIACKCWLTFSHVTRVRSGRSQCSFGLPRPSRSTWLPSSGVNANPTSMDHTPVGRRGCKTYFCEHKVYGSLLQYDRFAQILFCSAALYTHRLVAYKL